MVYSASKDNRHTFKKCHSYHVVGLPQSNSTHDNHTLSASEVTSLSEADHIPDEIGLTCAVCLEGHSLEPSELLGLYRHIKKVSHPLYQILYLVRYIEICSHQFFHS
jgi:hypothetical protein